MSSNKGSGERLVYSTDQGKICPECQKPTTQCVCAEKRKTLVQGSGQVRVRRETGGRAGKTVTTIQGVPLHQGGLKALLRDLQKRCGSGGTLKDGVLEIQGDHCDAVMEELTSRGYQPKRSGG